MSIPRNCYDGPIKPIETPEHCPGGYSLHLYCKYDNPEHGFHEFPWEIVDCETGPASRAAARACGWIIHRDNTATCPKCVRALGLRAPPPIGASPAEPQGQVPGGTK